MLRRCLSMLIVGTLIGCQLLASVAALDLASGYEFKRRPLESVPDALVSLERFFPEDERPRCEQVAVLLQSIRGQPADQVNAAHIALASDQFIRKQFRALKRDSLRQLFIWAIDEMMENGMDVPVLHLYECLSSMFRQTDARARAYLNNKQLQQAMSQYKSIMDQSLDFLVDDEVTHPTLSSEDLEPSVRKAMLKIFDNDPTKIALKFPSRSSTGTKVDVTLATPASTDLEAVEAIKPKPIPDEKLNLSPQSEHQVEPETQPEIKPEPELGTAKPEVTLAPVPEAEAESRIDGAGQDSEPLNQQVDVAEEAETRPLEDDDLALLKTIGESIKELYFTMPTSTRLADRCAIYSQVVEAASKGELTSKFVQQVSAETAAKPPSVGVEQPFVPDEAVRLRFVAALAELNPKWVGNSVYLDLISCSTKWLHLDATVEGFLNSFEVAETIKTVAADIVSNPSAAA